jgi:hypothetical protein
MDHDRSLWFASGLVIGLLIGAGIVGGLGWQKLQESRAETALEREKVEKYEEDAREELRRAKEFLRNTEEERRKAEAAFRESMEREKKSSTEPEKP